MMKNRAKWAPQHGQITKIWLSDRCGGKTIPTAMKFGYDRHESEGYLGNIGWEMPDKKNLTLAQPTMRLSCYQAAAIREDKSCVSSQSFRP